MVSLDMLIAAHAKSAGAVLVTNNTKEFKRVSDLKIENWVSRYHNRRKPSKT